MQHCRAELNEPLDDMATMKTGLLHRMRLPLGFPFLSPAGPYRGCHIQRCHIRSTRTSCRSCSSKPEAFYVGRTAAWLSHRRRPW